MNYNKIFNLTKLSLIIILLSIYSSKKFRIIINLLYHAKDNQIFKYYNSVVNKKREIIIGLFSIENNTFYWKERLWQLNSTKEKITNGEICIFGEIDYIRSIIKVEKFGKYENIKNSILKTLLIRESLCLAFNIPFLLLSQYFFVKYLI